ncbi:MAG: cell division protein ZapA [Hyphomicrobiaceae bacterium]
MGHVTVTLNGRSYRLRCGDGEEGRLAELAEHLSLRIDRLAMDFGQHGDERLLVMAAILATDELLETKARVRSLEAEVQQHLGERASGRDIAPDAGGPIEASPASATPPPTATAVVPAVAPVAKALPQLARPVAPAEVQPQPKAAPAPAAKAAAPSATAGVASKPAAPSTTAGAASKPAAPSTTAAVASKPAAPSATAGVASKPVRPATPAGQ